MARGLGPPPPLRWTSADGRWPSQRFGLAPFVPFIAVAAGIVPMLAYLAFIYWLDRYEREPWWLVGLVFLWGGFGGSIFGCLINSVLIGLFSSALGPEQASWAGQLFVAPLVEEATKIVPLFLLIFHRHFDNATDGLIYGAACGLGFAMTENAFYFYHIGSSEGLLAMETNILMRTCFTALVHCAASASWGFFLGLGRYRGKLLQWVLLPPVGYAVAVGIHALWNLSAISTQAGADIPLPVGPLTVVMVLAFLMFALTQASLYLEHCLIKAELEEEAELGLMPAQHARIIPFWLKRRRKGWLAAGIDQDRYVNAATLLAFRKSQARHATKDEATSLCSEVEQYRREVAGLLGSAGVSTDFIDFEGVGV